MNAEDRNTEIAADLRTKSDAEFANIRKLHEAATIIRGIIKDSGEDPFFIMLAIDRGINIDEEHFENFSNLFAVEAARRAALVSDQAPAEDATAA